MGMSSEPKEAVVRSAVTIGVSMLVLYGVLSLVPLKSPWNASGVFSEGKAYYDAIRFLRFNVIYLPLLFLLFLWRLRHRPCLLSSLWHAGIYGVVAGYCAGLVAYPLMAFLTPDGLTRLFNTLRIDYAWAFILLVPFIMSAWLFGALVGLLSYVIEALKLRRGETTRGRSCLR